MGENPKDKAKRLILARRARFVAAALASVAVTGAEACGGGTEPVPTSEDGGTSSGSSGTSGTSGNPQPCLTPPNPSSSSSGNPQPCLDVAYDAGEPQPCLKVAYDAGNPQPCLSMPAPDAGKDQ